MCVCLSVISTRCYPAHQGYISNRTVSWSLYLIPPTKTGIFSFEIHSSCGDCSSHISHHVFPYKKDRVPLMPSPLSLQAFRRQESNAVYFYFPCRSFAYNQISVFVPVYKYMCLFFSRLVPKRVCSHSIISVGITNKTYSFYAFTPTISNSLLFPTISHYLMLLNIYSV